MAVHTLAIDVGNMPLIANDDRHISIGKCIEQGKGNGDLLMFQQQHTYIFYRHFALFLLFASNDDLAQMQFKPARMGEDQHTFHRGLILPSFEITKSRPSRSARN